MRNLRASQVRKFCRCATVSYWCEPLSFRLDEASQSCYNTARGCYNLRQMQSFPSNSGCLVTNGSVFCRFRRISVFVRGGVSRCEGFWRGTLSEALRLGWVRLRVGLAEAAGQKRLLPSWIIVGAQRSGTSSLYEYLISHPLALRAADKEVHYFDHNYQRGLAWYAGHFVTFRKAIRIQQREGREATTGEATPYYVAHPLALKRIAQDLPGVKLLIILRNPVGRAYSHFRHERALGREPLASFEEALDSESERLAGEVERICAEPHYYSFAHQNFSYVTRGLYARQLKGLFQFFPRQDIHLVSSERLRSNPAETYAEVLQFLRLPDHHLPSFSQVGARRYPPMSRQVRSQLQRWFAPHNEELFDLIGRDLGWNRTQD